MPQRLTFKNTDTQRSETHDPAWYRRFLQAHVQESGLQIGRHLHKIGDRPVFIVAATGVGKTVAIPIHLFLWLCERLLVRRQPLSPMPHVLVVEPTIPICEAEAEHMNRTFKAFMAEQGFSANVHPFGAVTGTVKSNRYAPIRFVTTGVFEQVAEGLDPARCRVVIDEAHRVLAQSPGAEIAACVARSRGVLVDWMSATVDTSDLVERFDAELITATEERYPILKLPTNAPLEECVGDIVVRCLIHPKDVVPAASVFSSNPEQERCNRARQHLLAEGAFQDPVDHKKYPGLAERAQGMLVVVNSHRGVDSDTRRIADRVRDACFKANASHIEVLRLASSVVRDPDQQASFQRQVAGVERRGGRYVVIATNVVEVGVTFPSLDYVLTMDTELETARIDGFEITRERPLSVNAFLQRIGRVGRRRAGMAFLTREGEHGAAFSTWTPNELATKLKPDPISFAISRGNVCDLAFLLYDKEIAADTHRVSEYLARGGLPSRPERDESVLRQIMDERAAIKRAGLSDDGRGWNAAGHRFRETGVVTDLELGSLLAHCACLPGALPYLALVTAANPEGLRGLLDRRTSLEGDEPTLAHRVPFARTQFQRPLAEVAAALCSPARDLKPDAISSDEPTAQYIMELRSAGYAVDDPRPVERDGRADEPALLTMSRGVIRLDQTSELFAVYDIARWFVGKYRGSLKDKNLAKYERQRVREALREDARLMGLDAGAIVRLLSGMEDVARHAKIDLGARETPPELPDDLLARLMLQSRSADADDAAERRHAIAALHRKILHPRPTAALPEATAADRRQFLRIIADLELFMPVELEPGEDDRGNLILSGAANHNSGVVTVAIDHWRTSLRPRGRAGARGRLVRHEQRDGVKHLLNLASLME